ncbi:mitochondrial import receptor subunit Tom40 [Pelomyxa schiedti]|nr:mitochondrial import receptor subunit Tom40 [Pelomyxa schiedti]
MGQGGSSSSSTPPVVDTHNKPPTATPTAENSRRSRWWLLGGGGGAARQQETAAAAAAAGGAGTAAAARRGGRVGLRRAAGAGVVAAAVAAVVAASRAAKRRRTAAAPREDDADEEDEHDEDEREPGRGGRKTGEAGDGGEEEEDEEQQTTNPGRLDELNKECKAILGADTYDGMRCEFTKQLFGGDLLVTHLLNINGRRPIKICGNIEYPEGYIFATQWTPSTSISMTGRVDNKKVVFGSVAYSPFKWLQGRVAAEAYPDGRPTHSSVDLHLIRPASTSYLKVHTGRMMSIGHLHAVTPRLSVACENLFSGRNAINAFTLAFRYARDFATMSGLWVLKRGVDLSYAYQLTPTISAASQLVVKRNPTSGRYETTAVAGWEYRFADSLVKGKINNKLGLTMVVEEPLGETVKLNLCAEADFRRHTYGWGMGMQLDS